MTFYVLFVICYVPRSDRTFGAIQSVTSRGRFAWDSVHDIAESEAILFHFASDKPVAIDRNLVASRLAITYDILGISP